MQLLKGIVIGLGVLIVLGLGLLVYGLTQKAANPDRRVLSNDSPNALKPFDDLHLDLKGCTISKVDPAGESRAYLLIGGRDKNGTDCNRIIVVDTVRGRVLGTITP